MNNILWIFVTDIIDLVKDYEIIDDVYCSKIKKSNHITYLFIDQKLESFTNKVWTNNTNLEEIINTISKSSKLGKILKKGSINILFHDKHIGVDLSASTPEKGNPWAEVLNDVNLLEETFDTNKKEISFAEYIEIPNFKRKKESVYDIGGIEICLDTFFIFRHVADGICYKFMNQVAQGNVTDDMSKEFTFFFNLKIFKQKLYKLRCELYRNYPFYSVNSKEISIYNDKICKEFLDSTGNFAEKVRILENLMQYKKEDIVENLEDLEKILGNPVSTDNEEDINNYAEEVRNTFNAAIAAIPYSIYD